MKKTIELPDRRLLLLLPSAFMTAVAVGLIGLGMLFILKDAYGATPVTVAWFASISSLAYFVGCISFRPLAHRIKAASSMAFMNAASALLLVGHLLFRGLASAFLVYGLIGLFTALFWPRLMGWLTSGIEGAALSKATGAFSMSWSAGSAIAPYLAGLLAERGLFVPVYAAAAIFALNWLFLSIGRRISPSPSPSPAPEAAAGRGRHAFFSKRRRRGEASVSAAAEAAPQRAPQRASQRTSQREDRSTPLRYPAWIGVFLIYAFVAVFFNIFPLYARDVLGFSEATIGFVLLIRAAAMSFGFWLFGRLSFWQFRPALIPAALIFALALDLAFIAIRSPLGFCLGLAAAGLVQAALYGASIFYGASGAPDRDSRVTVHESLLTVGQILGTLIAGLMYQLLSWPYVFVGVGTIMALGLGGQIAVIRRGR